MIPVFAPSFIPFSGGGEETETTAWVAEVISNGGSVSSGRRTIVNTLIVGLKTDGIWDKLDRLWLFAAEDEESALTDLVGLTLATAVNTPGFTVDEGYTGDGSTSYVDTNYNMVSDAVNFAQNSAFFGAWSNTSPPSYVSTSYPALMGRSNNADMLIPSDNGFPTGGTYYSVNGTNGQINNAVSNTSGLFCVSRTGASAISLYRNGTSVKDSTEASASPANETLWLDRSDLGYANFQVCAAAIGGGLSATDASNFYSRLSTYMTAVGVL